MITQLQHAAADLQHQPARPGQVVRMWLDHVQPQAPFSSRAYWAVTVVRHRRVGEGCARLKRQTFETSASAAYWFERQVDELGLVRQPAAGAERKEVIA